MTARTRLDSSASSSLTGRRHVMYLCGFLFAITALVSCADSTVTETNGRAIPASRSVAATTPNTGFTFLTPTVRAPGIPAGDFDATRSPTVRVECVTATGPTCPVVATMVMGPGGSGIKLDVDEQLYRVNWTSPSTIEIGGGRYRIVVLDGSIELGSADAFVTTTTKDASQAGNAQIAIVRGKPVNIKFRITTAPTGDALAGPPSAPAVEAFPDARANLDPADFDQLHPDLRPLPVSFNTVLVRLASTATVGETNALLRVVNATLLGGSRGIDGRVPGLLVLRFATTSHAQLAPLLAILKVSPIVLGAVPEALLDNAALPQQGSVVPTEWAWDLRPAISGNWGLKTARVPQLWNLNRFVKRQGALVRTGIWERGDVAPHSDLTITERLGTSTIAPDLHATAVAGVVAATHDNGGIDGVTPFAQLVTSRFDGNAVTTSGAVQQIRQWSAAGVRVVNASYSYDWGSQESLLAAIATSSIASAFMDVMGGIVRDGFERLQVEGAALPIVAVAAGNQSSSSTPFPTRIAGPLQNAAVMHGVAPIVIVEALRRTFVSGPLEQRVERTSFTDIGGHIAAAGEAIMTTVLNNEFIDAINGTSFSAPLVTGVISYLYALYPTLPAPTMSTNPIRDLLVSQGVPVAGSPVPSIDAFAVALSADALMGSDRALRALLDIDDGTLDGNTRVDLSTNAEVVRDSVGGDGVVNMSDFRRWRDWRLQAETVVGANLNGRPDHPARDLNFDGKVSAADPEDGENIYPRGDFNGDGRISSSLRRAMPAAVGGGTMTDLEVFQRLFSDSTYTAAELPELLNSGDIEIRANACLAIPGAASARSTLRRPGQTAVYKTRLHLPTATTHVYTVPVVPGMYRARIEVFDASGESLGSNEQDFVPTLGGDLLIDMPCLRLVLSASAAATVVGGVATPVTLIASLFDQSTLAVTFPVGAAVTVVNTNATPASAAGVIGSDGTFTISVTPSVAATTMTVRFDVQLSSGLSGTVQLTRNYGAVVAPPRSLDFQIVSSFTAGKPNSPIRYRARVTSIEGANIVWTSTAASNGTGWIPFGPANYLISGFTVDPVVTVNAFTFDTFGNLTYVENTRLAGGITITTTACVFKNGVQVMTTQNTPFCSTITSFF